MNDHANSSALKEIDRFVNERKLVERIDPELRKKLTESKSFFYRRAEKILADVAHGKSHDEIVAEEVKFADFTEKNWSYDRAIAQWSTRTSAFLNEFSRWIPKRASKKSPGGHDNPTAMATYNPSTEELEILFNPRFLANVNNSFCSSIEHDLAAGKQPKFNQAMLTDAEGGAVYEHEMLHIINSHVTSRRVKPYALSNVSMDLAINSLIASCDTPSRLTTEMLLPGVKVKTSFKDLPKDVAAQAAKIQAIIASLPLFKAHEWYFETIKRACEQNGVSWGDKGIKIAGSANPDDPDGEWELFDGLGHDGWGDVPEELRDIVDSKIKHALREACRKADGESSGWGNIPQEMRAQIRTYAFGTVDWRTLLRRFVGNTMPSDRHRSIKRIDRKAPYIMPGLRRGRAPSLLVMVDQSGSVDDAALELAFGALSKLSKKTTFDVVPFDETVGRDAKFTWHKGSVPKIERVKCGGTNFDNAIRYANAPENRGKYDGVIVVTDGECSRNVRSRNKLAWIIVPGRQLGFEPASNEMLIQMTNDSSK